MSALYVCEKLLGKVKSSNLNFVVRETPYSVFITLRKSFASTKETNNHVLEQHDEIGDSLQTNNEELREKYDDIVNKYNKLFEEFEDMKTKIQRENDEKNKLLDRIINKKMENVKRFEQEKWRFFKTVNWNLHLINE